MHSSNRGYPNEDRIDPEKRPEFKFSSGVIQARFGCFAGLFGMASNHPQNADALKKVSCQVRRERG
jgi:hypothetical protein